MEKGRHFRENLVAADSADICRLGGEGGLLGRLIPFKTRFLDSKSRLEWTINSQGTNLKNKDGAVQGGFQSAVGRFRGPVYIDGGSVVCGRGFVSLTEVKMPVGCVSR